MFNQVMLAKQSWRILRSSDSLLYKVLKGRYFRDGDFFRAKVGVNSSLTWKSIVWGRELFQEGYRWRVGNGRHIYLNHDPWLIRKWKKNPLMVPEHLSLAKVGDLITNDGDWNEELIRRNFIPSNVEDIFAILIGHSDRKDEIIWVLEKKCIFTVKSVYHLANNLVSANEFS